MRGGGVTFYHGTMQMYNGWDECESISWNKLFLAFVLFAALGQALVVAPLLVLLTKYGFIKAASWTGEAQHSLANEARTTETEAQDDLRKARATKTQDEFAAVLHQRRQAQTVQTVPASTGCAVGIRDDETNQMHQVHWRAQVDGRSN